MTARHSRYDELSFRKRKPNPYSEIDKGVLAIYYLHFPELRHELDFNTQILPGLEIILGKRVNFEDLATDSDKIREDVKTAIKRKGRFKKAFKEAQELRLELPVRNYNTLERDERKYTPTAESHHD